MAHRGLVSVLGNEGFRERIESRIPRRSLFEEVRRLAAENRFNKAEVVTTRRFSQIVLETVQSIQRPESSFEKRTST